MIATLHDGKLYTSEVALCKENMSNKFMFMDRWRAAGRPSHHLRRPYAVRAQEAPGYCRSVATASFEQRRELLASPPCVNVQAVGLPEQDSNSETRQADRASRSDFWMWTVGIGEVWSFEENAKTGPTAKNKVAMARVYRIEKLLQCSDCALLES